MYRLVYTCMMASELVKLSIVIDIYRGIKGLKITHHRFYLSVKNYSLNDVYV